jgi:hypothetical protein
MTLPKFPYSEAAMTPSTSWKEQIAADETERFERYADQIVAMQREQSARSGNGRALHRKQVLGLTAKLEVLGDLPEPARHGLFARPSVHEARVRLSNAGPMVLSDRKPDIRGFAIKVLGVEGQGALGGPTTNQDFALINRSNFGFPGPELFAGLVVALPKGPLAVLGYFIKQLGFFRALGTVRKLAKQPRFSGFATEKFFSAAPIACGPYAVRVRIVPRATEGVPAADWTQEMKAHLAKGPIEFDFELQFFVDEKVTPIEDGSVDWPESESPWVKVARLTIPPQPLDGDEGKRLTEEVEQGKFDPWSALVEHRPLGSIMRARKPAYFKSQQARGAV